MPASPELRWWLFVDESGDPDDDLDVAIVGGVLVPQALAGGSLPRLGQRLQAALAAAAPEAPWPIHAWLTRRPVLYALWPAARGDDGQTTHLAIGALRGHAPEALERSLGRLRAGRDPDGEDVRALDQALLVGAPAAWRTLRQASDRTRASLGRVLETLAREGGDAGVLAFTAAPPARGEHDDGAPRGDPYLGLLAAALERVSHALALQGGSHRVDLLVLTRDVPCPLLGVRRPLDPAALAEAAAAAAGSPERALRLGAGVVRLNPASVQGFDARTHAGLVLADFVANAARPAFLIDRRLDALVAELAAKTRLAWTSTPRALPHTAAAGRARRALAAWPPAPPRLHRWADEQAQRWSVALAEARGA